jgi:hypothetical protein
LKSANSINKGNAMDVPASPIGGVELHEYLMANTIGIAANHRYNKISDVDEAAALNRDDIRGALRLHRFAVMNWLMMSGVSIAPHLLSDMYHPIVGQQLPDRVPDIVKQEFR